jgi:site-specific recombinase XerD
VADDESRWRLHVKPVFGSTLASRLTTPLLSKYVEKRLEAKAEAGTINRELSLLRGAFNLAYESTTRLVSQVPTFPMLKESNIRKGFLTDKQCDDLAASCLAEGVWMRAVFEVGCSYGWRREE